MMAMVAIHGCKGTTFFSYSGNGHMKMLDEKVLNEVKVNEG